jgi:hypothetical protein
MKKIAPLLAFVLMAGASCTSSDWGTGRQREPAPTPAPDTQAGRDVSTCMAHLLAAAREHMLLHHKDWPEVNQGFVLPMQLTDKGTFWELTFIPDPGTPGGVPVFEIEKTTGQIVRSYHTQ